MSRDVVVKVRLDSEEFDRDLRALRRRIGAAPAWCYVPWMRGFVVANAIAAPILLLLGVTR